MQYGKRHETNSICQQRNGMSACDAFLQRFIRVHYLMFSPAACSSPWRAAMAWVSEALGQYLLQSIRETFRHVLSRVTCKHDGTYPNRPYPTTSNDHFTVSVGSWWLSHAEPGSFALLDFSKSEHLDLTLKG